MLRKLILASCPLFLFYFSHPLHFSLKILHLYFIFFLCRTSSCEFQVALQSNFHCLLIADLQLRLPYGKDTISVWKRTVYVRGRVGETAKDEKSSETVKTSDTEERTDEEDGEEDGEDTDGSQESTPKDLAKLRGVSGSVKKNHVTSKSAVSGVKKSKAVHVPDLGHEHVHAHGCTLDHDHDAAYGTGREHKHDSGCTLDHGHDAAHDSGRGHGHEHEHEVVITEPKEGDLPGVSSTQDAVMYLSAGDVQFIKDTDPNGKNVTSGKDEAHVDESRNDIKGKVENEDEDEGEGEKEREGAGEGNGSLKRKSATRSKRAGKHSRRDSPAPTPTTAYSTSKEIDANKDVVHNHEHVHEHELGTCGEHTGGTCCEGCHEDVVAKELRLKREKDLDFQYEESDDKRWANIPPGQLTRFPAYIPPFTSLFITYLPSFPFLSFPFLSFLHSFLHSFLCIFLFFPLSPFSALLALLPIFVL